MRISCSAPPEWRLHEVVRNRRRKGYAPSGKMIWRSGGAAVGAATPPALTPGARKSSGHENIFKTSVTLARLRTNSSMVAFGWSGAARLKRKSTMMFNAAVRATLALTNE
ncbi:hypothetical protein [Acidocella facilis]|uniref:hypothetical protein n=1 Tax=Acidocella facilis TaxID=525 RepID=UPI001F2F64E9|nr:hypothetical protein [Acidocella facilis]